MKKILIFLFFLINTNSHAGTRMPENPDSEHLEQGEKYKCVVKISGNCKIDSQPVIASGVIIGKNWLLTAAHVFESMENAYFLLEEKKYSIKKIIINDDFETDPTKISSGDLALCFTEDVVIDFFPNLYEKKDENNKLCSVAGYGRTGTAVTGGSHYDGKKRAGNNIISNVTESFLFCEMSRINPTVLEFLTSHGDSGGGLFIDGKLAGIHSFVRSPNGQRPTSKFGDESGHTRISKYKTWIELNIKNHEQKLY